MIKMFHSDVKKAHILLFCIFILAWYFNYSYPLLWDDYVYSYVFNAQSFQESLPVDTQRVKTVNDIILSQYNHYFTWGGRIVAHSIAQFFLWKGKELFNVFNALIFLLIILEILWISNKGEINFKFLFEDVLWVFGTFWVFSVFLSDCFTWLTISCNYLWTTAILLLFVLIYVRTYFHPKENLALADRLSYNFLLFLFGMIAGCTNENTSCFVIIILSYFVFNERSKRNQSDSHNKILRLMICGLVGLIVGYLLLMLAPGNYNRYTIMLNDGVLDTGPVLIVKNLKTFGMVMLIRFLLYYHASTRLWNLKKKYQILSNEGKKVFKVASTFMLLSILSLIVMIFSPEFRMRSTFSSLIFILTVVALLRKQNLLDEKRLCVNVMADFKIKRILRFIMYFYVCMTVVSSVFLYMITKEQNNIVMQRIWDEKIRQTGNVIVVEERPKLIEDNFELCFILSGGHLPYVYTLTKDENFWINKDIALYYGIRAIRAK